MNHVESLPADLDQRLRILAREQLRGRLSAALAIELAEDLVAAGIDNDEVIAVACLSKRQAIRSDAEPLVRSMLGAFGLPFLAEGDQPAPEVGFQDVELRLIALADEVVDRSRVAAWARDWIAAEVPLIEPHVRQALTRLCGVDEPAAAVEYLYEQADFTLWLDELRRAEHNGKP